MVGLLNENRKISEASRAVSEREAQDLELSSSRRNPAWNYFRSGGFERAGNWVGWAGNLVP